MLKDEYYINIIGRQSYSDDTIESGEVTLKTTGTYTQRDGARFVSYKEYDSENPRVYCTSVLKVEDGRVTMMRTGTSTRLILEHGRRHTCIYDTGCGALSVGVYTSELSSNLDENGGTLKIKYTLDIDSNLTSLNEIEVDIKPAKGV